MRILIGAGILAAAVISAGCATGGESDGGQCAAMVAQCRADCDEAFEQNPSSWDYQSCLKSCEPDPGAICNQ
ncbi:MAG: hypothetical protein R3C55_04010 [Parvularculaceae bacterium]